MLLCRVSRSLLQVQVLPTVALFPPGVLEDPDSVPRTLSLLGHQQRVCMLQGKKKHTEHTKKGRGGAEKVFRSRYS